MRTNRLDEAEFIAFLKDVSKNMVFCRRSLGLAFVESQEQLAPPQCSPLNLLGASVFYVLDHIRDTKPQDMHKLLPSEWVEC